MTAAKKVIERFYEVEQGMNEYGDGPYVNFSITVSARDWSLYKAISERFGVTTKSLIADNLVGYPEELFMALAEKDREDIADVSSVYYHEQLKKNGVCETNVSGSPSSPWHQYKDYLAIREAAVKEAE